MFCPNCGSQVNPTDKFCGGCGAPVVMPQAAPAPAPAPAGGIFRKAKQAIGKATTPPPVVPHVSPSDYEVLHRRANAGRPYRLQDIPALLHVPEDVVRVWVRKGDLPATMSIGEGWVVPSAVIALLEKFGTAQLEPEPELEPENELVDEEPTIAEAESAVVRRQPAARPKAVGKPRRIQPAAATRTMTKTAARTPRR